MGTNLVWSSRAARALDRPLETFWTSPTRHGPRESGGSAGRKWNRAKCCAGAGAGCFGGGPAYLYGWPTRGQLALSPPAMTLRGCIHNGMIENRLGGRRQKKAHIKLGLAHGGCTRKGDLRC
ncbi:hypothetical protein B0T09DRAFT_83202 [Sordaria sp. MPI-SDFR-AT-0083]|nr:hypothetical protein B0T09DRAFT_83202 [Sordaria sp. MPI-SDFR-AT-0083]